MADTPYAFVIVDEFPNDKAEPEKLKLEILGSSPPISSASYQGSTCDGDPQAPGALTELTLWFDDPLSAGDETQLGVIVAAHDGVPGEDIDTSYATLATTGKMLIQDEADQADESVGFERDGSGNLMIQDQVAGQMTLTQVASGGTPDLSKVLIEMDGTFVVDDNGAIVTET